MLNDYLIVLLFSSLPALGNIIGGFLAELINVTARRLSMALHAAAGIILAVVSVELLPTAMQIIPPWLVAISFIAGGVFFLLIDKLTHLVRVLIGGDEELTGPLAIFFGVSIELFSDGIMIGVGSTVALGLAFLLALAQLPADIPEGLATIAAVKNQGVARRTRLWMIFALVIPVFLGATIGYWLMRGRPEWMKMVLLVLTSGILTTLIVEEIAPQAHKDGEARFSTLIFVSGFALFILIASYID